MSRSNPLAGRTIIVTRPRHQADHFVQLLRERGASVVLAPMIRVEPPTDELAVTAELQQLDRYDWLVFTSANGVRSFLPAARSMGVVPEHLRICAIGEATAREVVAEGASVDLIPKEYVAESVVEALQANTKLEGARILLARAEDARQILPNSLRDCGAEVTDLPVYRTVPDPESAASLKQQMSATTIDLIVFTSSSTARNFHDLVASDPGSSLVASIGPITSETVRSFGWRVDIEADPYSAEGLVEAITEHYRREEV